MDTSLFYIWSLPGYESVSDLARVFWGSLRKAWQRFALSVCFLLIIFNGVALHSVGLRYIFVTLDSFEYTSFNSMRPSDAYICVSKLSLIGSDNGLWPGRCQVNIWTNAGILLIGTLGTKIQWNLNRNLYIFIQENAFTNVVWKMVAILSRPQCVNRVTSVMFINKFVTYTLIPCVSFYFAHITTFALKSLLWYAPNPKTSMFLVSSCSCLCPIYWSQVLGQNRRCS